MQKYCVHRTVLEGTLGERARSLEYLHRIQWLNYLRNATDFVNETPHMQRHADVSQEH